MIYTEDPFFPCNSPDGDETYKGVSLTVYAAIHLKVPASGIEEIDAMIRRAKRDEIAESVLTSGKLLSPFEPNPTAEAIAENMYLVADAMLSQSEKEKV